MPRRPSYNDDPALAAVPLSPEEAAAVAEDPRQVRSREQVRHLALRALATANQMRQTRVEFDNELRRRTAAMPRTGLQPTLSPEQAARFLSPEQLTKLFDRFSQERLEAIDVIKARAQEHERRQGELLEDLRTALAETADAPDAELRTRLLMLLGRSGSGEPGS